MPPSGVLPLSLMEMNIINKSLTPGGGQQQHDFTVPPSTLAITVFVQSTAAGTDSRYPPTVFNANDLSASNLENIQVTYGSVTKPATLYTSQYDETHNFMIQRWIESNYNANKFNKWY